MNLSANFTHDELCVIEQAIESYYKACDKYADQHFGLHNRTYANRVYALLCKFRGKRKEMSRSEYESRF